ncbi:MAG TPA: triose-phosphate isomerase [Thermoanaerobaculia bacterium]|nr:triose-phosphate isomerase [Thermoanaerobaculia bacterium]
MVAGNWKMHLLAAEAASFCRELRHGLAAGAAERPKVILFPSFPLLPAVARELAGSGVAMGAQDLHPADRGAHTGDVSGPQLVDAGCGWVLCGHSERRRDHAESDELVARKVAAAARHRLTPLLCVGETREQREAGETLAVLERQVSRGLAPLLSLPELPASAEGAEGTEGTVGSPRGSVIAYEPVWAIGTGLTASPETAEEAHQFLRATVSGLTGEEPAAVTLLYGGSVTAANAAGLIAQPDVDGFLVGGASLDPRQFLAIIACSG